MLTFFILIAIRYNRKYKFMFTNSIFKKTNSTKFSVGHKFLIAWTQSLFKSVNY